MKGGGIGICSLLYSLRFFLCVVIDGWLMIVRHLHKSRDQAVVWKAP